MSRIRPGVPGDAKQLAELFRELGYATAVEALRRQLAAGEEETGRSVFVAEVGGNAVGVATVQLTEVIYSDQPVALLGALVVRADHRRRGLGRELVEAAAEWARDRGASRLTVASGVSRDEVYRRAAEYGVPAELLEQR